MHTITVVTDRGPFEDLCEVILAPFGFSHRTIPFDQIASSVSKKDPIIFDGGATFIDDDALLTGLGLARAAGAVGVVVIDAEKTMPDIEDILDSLCPGLVARSRDEFVRVVRLLARSCDDTQARSFEYVTVSPHADALLVIWRDGSAELLPRPLGADDDRSEIAGVDLSEDAAVAIVTLASGNKVVLEASAVAHACTDDQYFKMPLVANSDIADQQVAKIGERLRFLRLSVGLTQAELARRSGIKRPNIARLEAGRHTPSLETLGRLASAIGIPTARVFSPPF